MNFDFTSIFGGGYRSDYSGENYGVGRSSWGRNPSSWGGNYGAVQARYGGDTQILPNLNTQSMDSRYGASFASGGNPGGWGGNSGGWGNAGGFGFNTGWGNRSNESGRYYDYPSQPQPYDNFLINGFSPGYAQDKVVATRDRRRMAEANIDLFGKVGAWQPSNPGYPLSLYNV
jgi:hypothetical protein